jgi:hypothetical protein
MYVNIHNPKIGTNLTNAIRLTTKNVLVNEIFYSIPE